MTKELEVALTDLFDLGSPAEPLGTIPAPHQGTPKAVSPTEGTPTEETQTAPAAEPPAPSEPVIPLHTQFTAVRTELLQMEAVKKAGKPVDMKRVQELCNQAADLMAQIQTSTTGPKKKLVDGEVVEKKTKAPKAKKASTIAHLNIPDGDDF